jgi:hypothetical protein
VTTNPLSMELRVHSPPPRLHLPFTFPPQLLVTSLEQQRRGVEEADEIPEADEVPEVE